MYKVTYKEYADGLRTYKTKIPKEKLLHKGAVKISHRVQYVMKKMSDSALKDGYLITKYRVWFDEYFNCRVYGTSEWKYFYEVKLDAYNNSMIELSEEELLDLIKQHNERIEVNNG